MVCPDRIAKLIEQRQKLLLGARNQNAKALFVERIPEIVMDKFREVPRPQAETGKIPVIVCLDRPLWGKLLNFDLDQYYLDPEAFLEHQCRMDLFHLKNIPDDNFFDESIQVWGGPGFESTLFGMKQEYSADNEPWLRHVPLIDSPESLANMPEADFWTSGPMPEVLSFHERLLELLDGTNWNPIPPGWIRGPLGLAEELRGIENLVMDAVLQPDFVRDIMTYVGNFRKKWCTERAAYLGCSPLPRGLLFNDEVQVPMISPRLYKKTVLPFELDLHDFFQGVHYWHSCGDATPFTSLVNEIPVIDMIQAGAYSDPVEIVKTFGQRTAIEMAVHPIRDFADASEEVMRSRLDEMVRVCQENQVKAAFIRLTAYETTSLTPSETLDKVLRWVEIAREATRSAV